MIVHFNCQMDLFFGVNNQGMNGRYIGSFMGVIVYITVAHIVFFSFYENILQWY